MSDLNAALQHLYQATLAGDEQDALRRQIVEFCEQHSDALHRSSLTGHLTASAAVVDPERNAALVMHHVKLDRWLQPGGHADGDGNLANVALREATEETGIEELEVLTPAVDLDIHSIPERPGEPEHLHLDVRFVVLAPSGCSPIRNHESHELAWWQPGSGPAIDDSTERLLIRAFDWLATR